MCVLGPDKTAASRDRSRPATRYVATTRDARVHRLAVMVLSVTLGLLGCGVSAGQSGAASAPATYEGFGASTPGGSAGDVIHVTTLDDSGPGSFREAVSQGNRTVVFDVGGTIELTSAVYVNGAFVTVDGFTAPPPGITLRAGALVVRGNHGAHDVIVRGIRVRDTPLDGIQIAYGAYNVVIDHVSVHGAGDGNIDITEGSYDVTVSWSILAAPPSDKNMLIKYGASRISLHHNLFVDSTQRNPIVSTDDAGTPATDTTVDMRNNVVWNWGFGFGTMIFKGARANVVANFTSSPGSPLVDQGQGIVVCNLDCGGDLTALSLAYVIDNLSGDPLTTDMNAEGNVLDAFPAPPVTTQDAYTAAQEVLAQAGVRPLDDIDQQVLATIVLPPRPAGPNLSVSFLAVTTSTDSLTITERTTNGGTQPAGPSTTKFFLSADSALDVTDRLIASRSLGPLDPGASSAGSLTVPFPVGATGTYFLIARADADDAVTETSEADNAGAQTITIAGPDLIVAVLSVPGGAFPGASISVSETTRNQGTVATPSTTTTFFLSTDAALDAGDVPLGSRSVPGLAAGASNARTTTLTIPAAAPSGAYVVIARADAGDAVAELSEINNISGQPITIGSDLVVQSLTAPVAASPGVTIKISDSTKNLGAALSVSTTTRYYLSVDAVPDGGDTVLGGRAVPALATGGASNGSISVTIPASTSAGTYFIVARADADDVVSEADEGNNPLARVIEVGFDLSISSFSAPTAAAAGATISVSDTTKNVGAGDAPASTTAFFLSINSTLSADDVLIGSRAVPALARGATHSATSSVTIPMGRGGEFYIIALANADAGITVGPGNNKKSRTMRIGPDFSVSALTSPASATAGGTIAVSDVTRNTADVAAPISTTKYFLSTTSVLNSNAIVVGGRSVPALATGGSSSGSTSVTIPAGTAPGVYFLVAKSDGDDAVAEYSETNNTRARALTILP